MTDVVAVHGIGQQQSGRQQLLDTWRPALVDGVERFAGRNDHKFVVDVAYYADLYAPEAGSKGGPTPDMTGVSWNSDTLDFFGAIEDEVVEDSEEVAAATKSFKGIPAPVARLAGWLDRTFGVAGRILFFGDLVQVRRYQRDNALATEVRARVHEAAERRPRVLIGHSLGSVVAYEYLCRQEDHGIETFVTLGSPLGLRSVQAALRTRGADGRSVKPPGVERWVNVYDVNDPVACGGGLASTWTDTTDELVDNGNDAHAAIRYLGKKPTGRAVVEGLFA